MTKRILGCLLALTFLYSQNTIAQKYSNEFLSIGVGARAHGMGNAQVASVSDITGGYWNPAGLVNMTSDLQVAAMHAEWFGGIGKYDYAAFGLPVADRSRYLGLSFIRFGVDGIPNTLTLYENDGTINYNNVTTFSSADYAFMVHYAQKFEKLGLSIGATPKIVYRNVGKFANSWGFGVDLGAQYKYKKFQFGVLLRDITTTFNSWKFNFTEEEKQTLNLTNNEIPIKSVEITKPQMILGAAYSKDFNIGKVREDKAQRTIGILAELNLQFTTDGKRNTLISADPISISPGLGLEFHYNKTIFLRTGINNYQKFQNLSGEKTASIQPNFGVGFRLYKVHIDYAITNLGGNSNVLYSHLISAKVDINFDYIKKAIQKADIE